MVRQVAEERHIALTADEEDLLAARFNQMVEVFVGITPLAMPPRFPLPDFRRERDVISRGLEVLRYAFAIVRVAGCAQGRMI